MSLRSGFFIRNAVRVLALTAFAIAGTVHAGAVYRCRGADGSIAFQDHACAVAAAQSEVAIAPAPAPAPSPDYAVAPSRGDPNHGHALAARVKERREPTSYECRAADGEVFYRHAACPRQIATAGAAGSKRHSGSASIAVSAIPLSRAEACHRMSGSGGRAGRDRDDTVSTYDRNLGRDPCRYL